MRHTLLKSLLVLSIALVSCGDDDNMAPLGQYENGVLVINEGNFSDGDGSVTYYNRTSGELDQTIFQSVNEAPALGDVIQSGLSFNGLTYLIANNSNKVEVVNSFTFEGQFTMTDVALPRYMTVANGKGYLTEWVAFGAEGKVAVFNLATGEIEDELPVGNLPEAIVFANNKLFVTEAFGNSLYIIDLANTSSITTLTLGNGTSQMVLDANNNLWVACSGGSDINFNPLNDGSLYRINTTSNEVELAIELNTNYGGKIAINSSRNTIYFYVGNSIFEIDALTDPNLSESLTPLFAASEAISLYGIGVDPVTDIIYVGDSKSFLDDGEVFRFDPDGSFIDSFQAGRGPNGFLFN